eukprot:NODE_2060_length_1214_cov_12.453219_g1711_i0.p1 GENE.NODE_2060_length_1214_cov_12.453219_g1711_i0~~NODE_2060_length_1214_cov_12.453219_g1711_i0.p1  ORF type:complete len:272 (+),score=19.82 NODE_2060_length_1214_cov_12.453219_g1711_i0:262-1077(+)
MYVGPWQEYKLAQVLQHYKSMEKELQRMKRREALFGGTGGSAPERPLSSRSQMSTFSFASASSTPSRSSAVSLPARLDDATALVPPAVSEIYRNTNKLQTSSSRHLKRDVLPPKKPRPPRPTSSKKRRPKLDPVQPTPEELAARDERASYLRSLMGDGSPPSGPKLPTAFPPAAPIHVSPLAPAPDPLGGGAHSPLKPLHSAPPTTSPARKPENPLRGVCSFISLRPLRSVYFCQDPWSLRMRSHRSFFPTWKLQFSLCSVVSGRSASQVG